MLIYQINQNKPQMNPLLKLIILLAVYALEYAAGSSNKKFSITETLSNNTYNETSRNEAPANEPLNIDNYSFNAADGAAASGNQTLASTAFFN